MRTYNEALTGKPTPTRPVPEEARPVRFLAAFPRALHTRLKIVAAQTGKHMNALIVDALGLHLQRCTCDCTTEAGLHHSALHHPTCVFFTPRGIP